MIFVCDETSTAETASTSHNMKILDINMAIIVILNGDSSDTIDRIDACSVWYTSN